VNSSFLFPPDAHQGKNAIARKELDAQGNEIDPREELVNKILEYKKFKEASAQMAEMEAMRMLMVKRGNIQKELSHIGEEAGKEPRFRTSPCSN
jgi:segregation and condensation protein A